MPKVGEILVGSGALSSAHRDQALALQRTAGGRIGTVLLEADLVSEDALGRALATQHGKPYVRWSDIASTARGVIDVVPRSLAVRYGIIPYRDDGQVLKVAMKDPDDLAVIDELAFITGRRIEAALMIEARVMDALERFYRHRRSGRYLLLSEKLGRKAAENTEARRPASSVATPLPPADPTEEAPVETWEELIDGEADLAFLEETWPNRASARTAVPTEGARFPPPPEPPASEIPAEAKHREKPAGPALEQTGNRMMNAETREDIADAALDFLSPRYARVALFIARSKDVIGWSARGEGVSPGRVRSISIPFWDPSLFLNVKLSRTFYLGPLPPLPKHQIIAQSLGSRPPECAIFPVVIRDRVVAYIYVDGKDAPLPAIDLSEMKRLSEIMARAFAAYIVRAKRAREGRPA
jgi:MshEN domain